MEIGEFQKKCADIVKSIDARFDIKRDSQLAACQLIEEIGELIKEIDLPKLRNKEMDRVNLEGEFADVFLQLCMLAEMNGVNLEEAVNDKIKKLKERGYLK